MITHMQTLQEFCCEAIIKHGLDNNQEFLPIALQAEISRLSKNLIRFLLNEYLVCSGGFYNRIYYHHLKIDFSVGVLSFKYTNLLNQQCTVRLKAGSVNILDRIGGNLFLFPEKDIVIFDFMMTFDHSPKGHMVRIQFTGFVREDHNMCRFTSYWDFNNFIIDIHSAYCNFEDIGCSYMPPFSHGCECNPQFARQAVLVPRIGDEYVLKDERSIHVNSL